MIRAHDKGVRRRGEACFRGPMNRAGIGSVGKDRESMAPGVENTRTDRGEQADSSPHQQNGTVALWAGVLDGCNFGQAPHTLPRPLTPVPGKANMGLEARHAAGS